MRRRRFPPIAAATVAAFIAYMTQMRLAYASNDKVPGLTAASRAWDAVQMTDPSAEILWALYCYEGDVGWYATSHGMRRRTVLRWVHAAGLDDMLRTPSAADLAARKARKDLAARMGRLLAKIGAGIATPEERAERLRAEAEYAAMDVETDARRPMPTARGTK